MIYKDFVAEAAQKIMAQAVGCMDPAEVTTESEDLKQYAKGSVIAAKMLANELEADWQNADSVDGIHRFSDVEPFFDNYVNWTQTK